MSRNAAEIMSKNPRLKAQIDAAMAGPQRQFPELLSEPPKPTKYRNVKTVRHGMRFDSILEADVYDALVARYGAANVVRQVSIPIGSKRIKPDFMVILRPTRNAGSSFHISAFFADAKGFATEAWLAKANHLRDKHGIEIRLIKSAKDV